MYFYQHFRTKFAGLYVYAFSGGNGVKFIIQAGSKPRLCGAAEAWALPWRQEAYSVNCDMESTLPPTSSKLKFILPASSSKTRRFSILSAMGAKTLLSSFGPKPTSATKPQPMLPLIFPLMATLPFLTRCKTNFII